MFSKTGSMIGVFPNLHKEGSLDVSTRLLDWLEVHGYRGCVPPCLSVLVGRPGHDLPVSLWPERVRLRLSSAETGRSWRPGGPWGPGESLSWESIWATSDFLPSWSPKNSFRRFLCSFPGASRKIRGFSSGRRC